MANGKRNGFHHYKKHFPIIEDKERYSKEDVLILLEYFHGKMLANTITMSWEQLQLAEKIDKLEQEHGNALAFLMENESQKLQLEILNEKLNETYKTLEIISKTDSLTGTINRRTIIDNFEIEFDRVKRASERMEKILRESKEKLNENDYHNEEKTIKENFARLACAIIDLDHFKNINDTYGHLTGDMVLKKIGDVFLSKNLFRSSDMIGRYGGDEFMITLPETSALNALAPLKEFLSRIRQTRFLSGEEEIKVTLSIGISEYHTSDDNCKDIIDRADRALYHIKEKGRDGIAIFNFDDGIWPYSP